MKKNSLKYNNDEIDLSDLIKNFWDKKINFFLIILVSIFVGISYGNRGQELYQASLEIKPSSNSEFAVFFPINSFFSTETKKSFYTELNNKTILDMFIKDFIKYEQLIFVLKKKSYIKEEISKLSKIEQQKRLFGYAQKFTIEIITKNKNDQYFVKFKWHDVDEGLDILIETLNLVSKNIAKTIFSDLDRLVKIKKNFVINEDLNRIENLQEQAEIRSDSEALLNFESTSNLDYEYYFRGSKAINKEISIIKNRKYSEFTQIENEINSIRSYNEIKWVDYNLFLIKVEEMKNSNSFLKISIISGFIIAFLYIIFFTVLKSKKTN